MDVSLTTESIALVNSKKEFIALSNGYGSFLTIADAPRIWASRPDFLFNVSYRIAGFKADFETKVKEYKSTIAEIIQNSFSGTNFQSTFKSLYEDEYNEYIEWKKSAVKSNFTSDGAQLFDIITNLTPIVIQKPREDKKKPVVKKSPRIDAFVKRINELPQGKVLDVSKLEESGKGAVKRDPPKKGKMYHSPYLPIVSSDLDTYLLAVSMLPGGEDKYIQAVNYVREHGPITYTGNVPDIKIVKSVDEGTEETNEEELNPEMYFAPKEEEQTLPQEASKVYPIHDSKHYAKLKKEKEEKEAKEKLEKEEKEKIEREEKERIEKEEKEKIEKIEKEREVTYEKPRRNVFGKVDDENALIIPAIQQKDDMFSFIAADSSIVVDTPKNIKKMLVSDLKKMASLLGISGYSKLKKDELVEKIVPRIVFE